jgi:hypothetical protein
VKREAEEDWGAEGNCRNRWGAGTTCEGIVTRPMKGFVKIALIFGLLGGLMAYFIVPVQFSRKRALSPTEKAEYALTVNYCKNHCGPV